MISYFALEDGTIFEGTHIGFQKDAKGLAVFNTMMVGYQEIMTDPSSYGAMTVFTYPLIGNYGYNDDNDQSGAAHVSAIIVSELCAEPSNWRSQGPFSDYLIKHRIPGIQGVDTRVIATYIRDNGSMAAALSTDKGKALSLAKSGLNAPESFADAVSTKKVYSINDNGAKIAVLDLGITHAMLNTLKEYGLSITVYPAATPADELLSSSPVGIMPLGGPGTPSESLIETISALMGKVPVMASGVGTLALGKALGFGINKLKYGHHGGQPIKGETTSMTAQNHDYVLEGMGKDVKIIETNLNDGSIEGVQMNSLPVWGFMHFPGKAVLDAFFNAI